MITRVLFFSRSAIRYSNRSAAFRTGAFVLGSIGGSSDGFSARDNTSASNATSIAHALRFVAPERLQHLQRIGLTFPLAWYLSERRDDTAQRRIFQHNER